MFPYPKLIRKPADRCDAYGLGRSLSSAGAPRMSQWYMSCSTLIMSGFYGLDYDASWVPLTAVIAMVWASMFFAFGGMRLISKRLHAQPVRFPLAWVLLSAAFLVLILFSDFPTPILLVAMACLAGLAGLYVSLWNLSKRPKPVTPASLNFSLQESSEIRKPLRQPDGAPPTEGQSLPETRTDRSANIAPLMRPLLDKMMQVSMSAASGGAAQNRGKSAHATSRTEENIQQIRNVHGRLQRLARLDAEPPGEVRMSYLVEMVIDLLSDHAHKYRLHLVRPNPGPFSPIAGNFVSILTALYHLALAAIESSDKAPSREVVMHLSESGGLVWFHLDSPADPTHHDSYQQALELLASTPASVRVSSESGNHRIELAFQACGLKSRKNLRPVATPKTLQAAAGSSSSAAQQSKPIRILFVDDEPAIRELVEFMLSARMATVDAAATLEQVEKCLELHHYDAVILDIYMPKCSGLEVYERIVELAPELAGKIIFCTGSAPGGHVAEFLKEHNCPLVTKPFDSSVLARAIRLVLGRETQGQHSETIHSHKPIDDGNRKADLSLHATMAGLPHGAHGSLNNRAAPEIGRPLEPGQ